jgi:hypothetical protein
VQLPRLEAFAAKSYNIRNGSLGRDSDTYLLSREDIGRFRVARSSVSYREMARHTLDSSLVERQYELINGCKVCRNADDES